MEVFGLAVGAALRQPVCARPKGKFDLTPPAVGVCSARDDAVDPDAKYTGGTALEFARGDLPGWVSEPGLFGNPSAHLRDGVVLGFEVPTRGFSVTSEVSAALVSKYGEPHEVTTDTFTNGLGQSFEASKLSWHFADLVVFYAPVSASRSRGVLWIATPAEFVRMGERASKASESKRPL